MKSSGPLISEKSSAVTAGDSSNEHERRVTKLEQYLLMDEKEKDAEIQRAIARLQTRIQTILYALESDMHHADGAAKKKEGKIPRP
jgi:cephalosporin hydroxylase